MRPAVARWACVLGWAGCLVAAAQNADTASAPMLGLRGVITQSACPLTPSLFIAQSAMVVNLPALQTTLLLDAPFSPIALVPLRFGMNNPDLTCLNASLGGAGSQLLFDTALARVATRSGLLRNSAVSQPAQNVLVQLGLVGTDGMFTPMDLNQPQALNASLALPSPTADAQLTLNLGIRYVAERFVSEAYAGVNALASGASDVTPGNVSVFLPFVMNLK
jgi:hypothetical protein